MSEKTLKTRIKNRRDTVANWTSNNPVLLKGEIAIVEDTDGSIRFKVGDGSKTFSALAYTDEKLKTEIAAKGNKLAAAGNDTVPVYIDSDGTAKAIVSYSGHVSKQAIDWSGSSTAGYITPIDTAMTSFHSANRLQFMSPDAITIERSTDGGTTWAEATDATPTQKVSLTSLVVSNANVYSMNSGTTFTKDCQVRFILDASIADIYCSARLLLVEFSTNGNTHCQMKLEASTIGAPNTWVERWTKPVDGWSGWNSYPMEGVFEGYSNQNTNTCRFRLTFFVDEMGTTTTTTFTVNRIFLFGENSWISSGMGKWGTPYTLDVAQNVTFPANVSATKFLGGWEPSTPAQALTTFTTLANRSSVSDLNASLSNGITSFTPSASNLPRTDRYGTVVNFLNSGETQDNTSNWLTQIASTTSKELFYRTKINSSNFSKWEEIIKIADDDYFVLDGGTSTTVV